MQVYTVEIDEAAEVDMHVVRVIAPSGRVVEVQSPSSDYEAARAALATAWLIEHDSLPEPSRPVLLTGVREQLAAAAERIREDAAGRGEVPS